MANAASFTPWLGFLPGALTTIPGFAISADGSVVVGDSTGTGNSQTYRWTAQTGMVNLGGPGGIGNYSIPLAISADGSHDQAGIGCYSKQPPDGV